MKVEEKKFVFNYFSFFTAFALGIFYVYISSPKQRIIIKYPTPYNANNIQYKTDDNTCYKFNVEETKCDKYALPQPIM